MGALQSISFMAPWALAGLLALPVIWWLLRFTPPKPEMAIEEAKLIRATVAGDATDGGRTS